jgi:alpha-ribazole phosphatase
VRLILVRHPKPICANGLCYGRLDLECDPAALDAAAIRLGDAAQGRCIVTSPAQRALSLALKLSAEIAIEPRLQELHFGDWEGRLWKDIGRDGIDEWQRGLPASAPPHGESLCAMAARCWDWLQTLAVTGPPVLAVTHAGPIRVIRALLKGEPLLTYFGEAVPFAEPLLFDVPATLSLMQL